MNNVLTAPRRKSAGFTLIEVMIVVVIVGILASIAYPSYTRYVQQTREAEAQGLIMELAASLESYRAKNFSYKGATIAVLAPELNNNKYYNAKLDVDKGTLQSYVIEAEPKTGLMSGMDTLEYRSNGKKSWD